MRRTVLCIMIIISVIFSVGCTSYTYDGWKTINIDFCGSLKIPEEWVYYENNGLIYITDANQKPIMIQSHSYAGIEENDPGSTESNDFFTSVTCLRTLSSAVISNGAVYGEVLLQKGDTQTQNYFLEFGYDRHVQLVFWAETIDEAMVKRIAKSFVSE